MLCIVSYYRHVVGYGFNGLILIFYLDGFIFPSYVEDILGPCLFDFGYGPFRWCCLSRKPEDLHKTDMAAAEYIRTHNRRYQDYDNYVWVRDAEKNKLVVGTRTRRSARRPTSRTARISWPKWQRSATRATPRAA